MSDERPNRPLSDSSIERVVVAVDGSPHSLEALRMAAHLAARLEASLLVLYVEDAVLAESAALPGTVEIRSLAVSAGTFTAVHVRRQFRLQSRRVRQAAWAAADEAGVEVEVRVLQGRVADAILEGASGAGLLALGQAGSPRSSRRRLGQTTRAVLEAACCPVLILRRQHHAEGPVLAVYDRSEQGRRALHYAIILARRLDASLTVFLLATSDEEADLLRHEVLEHYGARVRHLDTQAVPSLAAPLLSDALRREQAALVVVPAEAPHVQRAHLARLLHAANVPLLLFR